MTQVNSWFLNGNIDVFQLAGGMECIIAKGKEAFDAGDFHWAAKLLNHAIFAESGNTKAQEALANTYDQLEYSS